MSIVKILYCKNNLEHNKNNLFKTKINLKVLESPKKFKKRKFKL